MFEVEEVWKVFVISFRSRSVSVMFGECLMVLCSVRVLWVVSFMISCLGNGFSVLLFLLLVCLVLIG